MIERRTKSRVRTLGLVIGGLAMTAYATSLVGTQSAQASPCTRLPLSDVAFGKEAATNAARGKLQEYATEIAKKRGWPQTTSLAKSNETVSCEVYLNLGPLGTEYRCLVTATFCAR